MADSKPRPDVRQHGFSAVVAALQAHPRPACSFLPCAECALATLCGGGCRSGSFLLTGNGERPICGPWRVQILCELLAEDRISCLEWPTGQLAGEARLRGIEVT